MAIDVGLRKAAAVTILLAACGVSEVAAGTASAAGPLRVSSCNPRYFSGGGGTAIYLTGSHTWTSFQDIGAAPLPAFDFSAYLDLLQKHNHNFMRLWAVEQAAWAAWASDRVVIHPLPYLRTGPGLALDGKPKFDLTKFNPEYFARLRARVRAAGDRAIYVSVMLFQGWSVETKGMDRRNRMQRTLGKLLARLGIDEPWPSNNPWKGHPFNSANNANGIDGDDDRDGEGRELHTLGNPGVTALQEAYVRKVVDALNDLDNVLYEISNESHAGSTAWQYHMIRHIQSYEQTKPKQHPVVMTWQWPGGANAPLFASPAEAVSPGKSDMAYLEEPPPADGRKVVIIDTDHLWGEGGNPRWVWKSFLRGLNPIFMDRVANIAAHPDGDVAAAETIRRAMGQTLSYSRRINLDAMIPRPDLCSTTYCLASEGDEYLVYLPSGGAVTVDLRRASGTFRSEWFNPTAGTTTPAGVNDGGGSQSFSPPFNGDAVLYIKNSSTAGRPNALGTAASRIPENSCARGGEPR